MIPTYEQILLVLACAFTVPQEVADGWLKLHRQRAEAEALAALPDDPMLSDPPSEGMASRLRTAEDREERAFQMLEIYGVPRERARSVGNGIDVLATRYRKQVGALENELVRVERLLLEAQRQLGDAP